MAILKSFALIEEETQSEIRDQETQVAQRHLSAWKPKVPITPIAVEPPRGTFREDTKAFAYDYSLRPSRNYAPQKRWSEI